MPEEAIEEAIRKVTRTESPSLVENNRRFHRMLTEGVPVEYHARDGRIVHEPLWLVDFADPDNNDWLAVNQFTVVEDRRNRRPDVVLFVNGLPLVVIELKNPADENATIKHAFNQFQTYKQDIPGLFTYNDATGALGRPGGPPGHADGRLGAVHALADHRRPRLPRPASRSWTSCCGASSTGSGSWT